MKPALSDSQTQHFLDHGYATIKNVFTREFARQWTDRAFERLGYDPDDPSTWPEEAVWMDRENAAPVKEIAPRAWAAMCDVVGGEDRIEDRILEIESRHFTTINSFEWCDAFIVNFPCGTKDSWAPPSSTSRGWHKDGSFFRHFLDSREQALLTVLYWSDVAHKGGGTFIAPDSIRHVARFLREHREGVQPNEFGALIDRCEDFVELTGETGDLVILHPFMLHTRSRNRSSYARFMTNSPIVLREPMNLDRSDADEFSLVERTTLRALGLERLDFRPTAPRDERWTVVR